MIFGVMKISSSRFSFVMLRALNSQPKIGSFRNQGTPDSLRDSLMPTY